MVIAVGMFLIVGSECIAADEIKVGAVQPVTGRFAFAAVGSLTAGATDVMTAWRPAVEGGIETADSSVRLFPLDEMLAETTHLLDGSSPVTQARLARMRAAQGVLGL